MSLHLQPVIDANNHPVLFVGPKSFDPAKLTVAPGVTVRLTSKREKEVILKISDPGLFTSGDTDIPLAPGESKERTVACQRSADVTYNLSAPLESDSEEQGIGEHGTMGGMTGTIKVGGLTKDKIPSRDRRPRARPRQEAIAKPQGR